MRPCANSLSVVCLLLACLLVASSCAPEPAGPPAVGEEPVADPRGDRLVLVRDAEGERRVKYEDLDLQAQIRVGWALDLLEREPEDQPPGSPELDASSLIATAREVQEGPFGIECIFVLAEGAACWFGDHMCGIIWAPGAFDVGCFPQGSEPRRDTDGMMDP